MHTGINAPETPDIPWSKMAGMRDILIHNYMSVDLKTVWNVAQKRLPELKSMLMELNWSKNA